ncbi:MAG: hypothetical protein M1824_001295 [Vezdaea acicularis]|nr:MAG: hypothetical protein M1824_001295 [Vezdaea acicularis]
MPPVPQKKGMTILTRSRTSSDSSIPSLKTPRTPRFAEATAVNSPIDGPTKAGKSPFDDPPEATTTHFKPQPQPSDVGFGYISDNNPTHQVAYVPMDEEKRGMASPLKSAMKVPGSARKMDNPLSPSFQEPSILSPTWKEEKAVEEAEKKNDIDQAKDIKIKTRVRMAKMVLRGVNFSCSLIILSLLATTFTIFNATRSLPPRNNLPAWANGTKTWPQITLLVMACVSLTFCLAVFWNYWRGGHRRAEKAAIYYTYFAVATFMFSLVMWGIAAGVLQGSRASGNGQDIWGWSCKDNKRKQLFQNDVSYSLVCRLQNWSLICIIIEVIVETITIVIYGVIFYRFYSKKRLQKTMDLRHRTRNDLYLAQLRVQSAPNTPGALSPTFKSPMAAQFHHDQYSKAEEGDYYGPQYAEAKTFSKPKPFSLQPPPIKVQQPTPTTPQNGFESAETVREHAPKAPGEQTYDAVPIPGAYMSPTSPAFPQQVHQTMQNFPFPGQAVTTDNKIERR